MRIAVLDDYAGRATELADWSGLGEVTAFRTAFTDPEALVAALEGFEVICAMRERTPLPAEVLDRLPALRLIVTSGLRNAAIDMEAATARGVTVCGTESRGTTTSELAMMLILALNRRLLPEAASLRAGRWQEGLGRDLAGLTLGLVGLGRLGGQMAALGRAFGMEVAAWSQNLTEARCAELSVHRCDSLGDLMAASDVVSVHLVLSGRSRGLIGREAFARMRPGAVFVNTSRAGIVDTGALIAGLRTGRPAMAGLDVFDIEPLPAGHPVNDAALQAAGKLLLTPHLGYTTEAAFRLFYTQMAEAIRAWTAGAPIRVIAAPA